MNEYFFRSNTNNPHIKDYNECYNRIKEKQALIMLKSTTVNEKILLLTNQIKNAEITVRACISALMEEQRRSSQMKAKYEKVMEILRRIEDQRLIYEGKEGNTYHHHVNGLNPVVENEKLVDQLSKNVNSNNYVKLAEKPSTVKPNYLDRQPPNKNVINKDIMMLNNIIPTIYVEEKTNSLNLELLEYKLANLDIINKISIFDPPPPLTNKDYINNGRKGSTVDYNLINDNKIDNVKKSASTNKLYKRNKSDNTKENNEQEEDKSIPTNEKNSDEKIAEEATEDVNIEKENNEDKEENSKEEENSDNKVGEENGDNKVGEENGDNKVGEENGDNKEGEEDGVSNKEEENNNNIEEEKGDNNKGEENNNNIEEEKGDNIEEEKGDNVEEEKGDNIEEEKGDNIEEKKGDNIEEEKSNNVEEEKSNNVEEENNNNIEEENNTEEQDKELILQGGEVAEQIYENNNENSIEMENVEKNKFEEEKENECKALLNEIINGNDDNKNNEDQTSKLLKNNSIKTFDLKFSSDCESLFASRILQPTSSKEVLTTRIITPKTNFKRKKSVDQIYKDIKYIYIYINFFF